MVIDLQAGTETHHGLDLMLRSSAGPIQVNAGAFQVDSGGNLVFIDGPHAFFTEDLNVPVCAVLTAPQDGGCPCATRRHGRAP